MKEWSATTISTSRGKINIKWRRKGVVNQGFRGKDFHKTECIDTESVFKVTRQSLIHI